MCQPDDQPQAHFILESKQRLSHSILWKLQRNYFNGHGIRAWNEAVVPHQITNNPWIAGAYAQMVFAWLRDWQSGSEESRLDLDQPVYIIELGSGNGRFGYLFLKKLLYLLGCSTLREISIKYVYTDFTEYNLDVLRSHPTLQPQVKAGLVDFARFELEEDTELHLSESGEVLRVGTVRNPIVVLANYVFDGIRQDLFRISGGELQEGLVTISAMQEGADLQNPELVSQVLVNCEYQSTSAEFYDDPAWNRILAGYRERLADTVILFPSAALTGLGNLRKIAADRLLLLSGDKGDVHEQGLSGRDQLHLAIHGSISLMVNYHAIGQYVLGEGGEFLSTSHLHSSLKITASLFGHPAAGHCDTRLAFDEFIEARGPDDFYSLRSSAERDWESMSLQEIVNYVRLSGWDHSVFLGCSAVLMEKAKSAHPTEIQELELMAGKVWENYFPLRETYDVAFHLGMLSMVILRFPLAIEFFQRSLELYGSGAATATNLAISYGNLGRWPEALSQVKQALEIDPELEAARALKEEIEGTITAQMGTNPGD